MHPTHAVAPCLMLIGKRPETVYCKGSGTVRKEVEAAYGCPYAFESALISLKDSDTSIEMARFLYHVARGYTESFNVYGERKTFEWQQLESEKPVMFSMEFDDSANPVSYTHLSLRPQSLQFDMRSHPYQPCPVDPAVMSRHSRTVKLLSLIHIFLLPLP